MIIKTKPIKIKIMKSENPLSDFKQITLNDRGSSKLSKKVIFSRIIGMSENESEYKRSINDIDNYIKKHTSSYMKFINGLNKDLSISEINIYQDIANAMTNDILSEDKDAINNWVFDFVKRDESLQWSFSKIFYEICITFNRSNKPNETMLKNFIIKQLFWAGTFIRNIDLGSEYVPKIIYYGDIKNHEFYFLVLCSNLGYDILYINPYQDMCIKGLDVDKYSEKIVYDKKMKVDIKFDMDEEKIQSNMENNYKTNIDLERKKPRKAVTLSSTSVTRRDQGKKRDNHKSLEELATLGKSVVMLKAINEKNEAVPVGSGILISSKGYILTNFHVVQDNHNLIVFFEDDDNYYPVDKIIKYHIDYDLALMKIDRRGEPIILGNSELVRGQSIVAIGSPFGLINSISEGIVSGFREFDNVKMVQITAPISPGSSGGALIDLSGRLVGVTTAGFSQGQNLNLAVPAEYIRLFARQFIE